MSDSQDVNAAEQITDNDLSTSEQSALENETNLDNDLIDNEEETKDSSDNPGDVSVENAGEAEADSTSVAKKPRHRQVNAAMREVEQRILKKIDDRLSVPNQNSENQEANANQVTIDSQQAAHYQMRINDFQRDCAEISASDNTYDQKVAKTLNSITTNQNPLSYLSAEATAKMIDDGITPAEIHEISEQYGDKIQPSTPDIEFRTIKMLQAKLKSKPQQKKTVKTAPKPSGSVSGNTTSAPKRDSKYYFNLFRGK